MSEVVDKKITEQPGWNWSDNQKRLVRGSIEPIVYDGKHMYTDGLISTDNPAIRDSLTSSVIQAIDPENEEDYLAKMDARINAIQISKEELEGPEWRLIGKMMNWNYNKKLIYALHSDFAFIGTDGEIHLVDENIKPDYNEWNW